MENKDYIQEELQELAPAIVQIEKRNVYSVSPGYFDNLSEEIFAKIALEHSEIANLPRLTPYKVPENYFEDSAKSILQAVTRDARKDEVYKEMEEISSLLNTISKKPVYTVPTGYFDRAINSPVSTSSKPAGKVLSIFSVPKVVNYVAAAVIIAFMAVGMYLLINNNSSTVREQKSNPTAEIKNLSEAEISNFLKTNFAAEDVSATSLSSHVKESDLKKSIKEMSDKEIQQFLQEEGETDEI